MTAATIADLRRLLGSDEVTQTTLSDETGVILDVDSLRVFSLNETGNFLLGAIRNGVLDEEELAALVSDEFEVSTDQALTDIRRFVEAASEFLLRQRSFD